MKTFHPILACVLLGSACNSGGRVGKPYYGPGSTGSTAAPSSATLGGSGVGSFSPGPSLSTPRAQHTATLLQDGRVLVTGGFSGAFVETSEVFDPATDTWARVSDLAPTPDQGLMLRAGAPTARRHHTAVALADGRVLVAGGHGYERVVTGAPVFEALVSCYVFDPQTNAFQAVGDLAEARFLHQGAALGSGDAIVTGVSHADPNSPFATNYDPPPLRTGERFDAASNRWTTFAANVGRTAGVAVERTSGGPLLYGGGDVADFAGGVLILTRLAGQTPQVYDEASGALVGGPSAALAGAPRTDAGGVGTSNGDAVFAGGRVLAAPAGQAPPYVFDSSWSYDLGEFTQSAQVVDTTERYQQSSGAFVAGPQLTIPRYGARCAELGATSDVLIVGGMSQANAPVATCEVWGVVQNGLLGTVDLTTARYQHTATTLLDGRILVAGGMDGSRTPVSSCELHAR